MHKSLLTFTCMASTDKEWSNLRLHWLKDGEPINLADPRITVWDEDGVGSLDVANVNSSDTGTYTCVASNGLDSDRKSARVKVIGEFVDPDIFFNHIICTCFLHQSYIFYCPYTILQTLHFSNAFFF